MPEGSQSRVAGIAPSKISSHCLTSVPVPPLYPPSPLPATTRWHGTMMRARVRGHDLAHHPGRGDLPAVGEPGPSRQPAVGDRLAESHRVIQHRKHRPPGTRGPGPRSTGTLNDFRCPPKYSLSSPRAALSNAPAGPEGSGGLGEPAGPRAAAAGAAAASAAASGGSGGRPPGLASRAAAKPPDGGEHRRPHRGVPGVVPPGWHRGLRRSRRMAASIVGRIGGFRGVVPPGWHRGLRRSRRMAASIVSHSGHPDGGAGD